MKLSKEQIENWRKVLSGMFGPYAFVMSEAQIEAYAENMQSYLNANCSDEE